MPDVLAAAKARLDRLAFYPEPVRLGRVRVVHAPWWFGLPLMRRFHGYTIGPLILVRSPDPSEDLIVHELCHVWQFQHRPVRMWLSYLVEGYRDNWHEVQARAAVHLTSTRPAR